MRRLPLTSHVALLILGCWCRQVAAEDWPTVRHDERRSSVSSEPLPLDRLRLTWTFCADQPPAPAWPGPARWDAYVKRAMISSMRNYDESAQLTVAAGSVYFGSSADDAIHCLDAATGQERWRFTTGGPVRLPPTVHDGRLYFGSDDGFAYCISADGGALHWKFRPSPTRLVIQDGRLISHWPVRTGVMVSGNLAYFGASLVPWEKSYVCALDADTGRVEGRGAYVQEIDHASLEGMMLAAADQLLITQGRAGPLWLTKSTGKDRGRVPGVNGGSFALVGADGNRYFGPGSHEGFLSETNAEHTTAIARKFGAVALVAHEGMLYALERRVLGCLRQKPEQWLWRRPSDLEECLILAGDTLIAGGNGKVVAFRAKDGEAIWQTVVQGRAQSLVVADGTLYVSTDEGTIHAFRADESLGTTALPPEPYRVAVPLTLTPLHSPRIPAEIRRGPIVRFTRPDTAIVTWETATPTDTTFVHGIEGFDVRVHNASLSRSHEVELTGLRQRTVYRCAILLPSDAEARVAGPFECDTHLNFCLPNSAGTESPSDDSLVTQLVSQVDRQSGICVLVGDGSIPLALEFARRTNFRVVILESDEVRVSDARKQLQSTGLYGARIAVLAVSDVSKIPATSGFANLVVGSSSQEPLNGLLVKELARILCPKSGRLSLRNSAGQLEQLTQWLPADAYQCKAWNRGLLISKSESSGIGEWTHQYGRADNATFAGETLAGACRTSDFDVQWLGRPGPRFQSDRGNRKPAPLCASGRLFVQGLDRVIALDSHNGTILWNLEIPDSRRFNIRNDSANWCADDDQLYLAVRDACWAFDARSGKLSHEYRLPADDASADWGYVGRQMGVLVGSRVRSSSAFQEFWGGEFWYTNPEGPLAAKVTSDMLFGIDIASGKPAWQYRGGAIVNTSIALAGKIVVFAESREPEIVQENAGRVSSPQLWNEVHLVALSLADGQELWRRPVDLGLATTMFSLACSQEHVVAVASAKGNYRVAVFRQADGGKLWETSFPWESSGKGGDSARPAIIGDKLYVSPRAFELATGKPIPLKLTRGACGSYAAAANVFITRLGNLGLWNPESNEATTWERLRPDCWLSAIPAGGLILAPEGGGGCSCGGWIETSIAFTPKDTP